MQKTKYQKRGGPRGGTHKLSSSQERNVLRRYTDGESAPILAAEYQCHDATIRNIVKRLGGTVRKIGGPAILFSNRDREHILTLWDAGMPYSRIAKTLGMSKGAAVKREIYQQRGIMPTPRPSVHPNWRGGRVTTNQDYVMLWLAMNSQYAPMANSAGYVLEHRLVMAEHLGRCLDPDETVHHVDGNRQNNDISNLQLRHGKHGNGQVYQCQDCRSYNVRSTILREDRECYAARNLA